MLMVALARVVLSTSLTVIPESTTTGVEVTLLPSVKAVVPPLVVKMGASFVVVTRTSFVAVLLLLLPLQSHSAEQQWVDTNFAALSLDCLHLGVSQPKQLER